MATNEAERSKVHIMKGFVLNPGDRVLLTVDHELDPVQATEISELLNERFPDVEFTMFAGATAIQVQAQ